MEIANRSHLQMILKARARSQEERFILAEEYTPAESSFLNNELGEHEILRRPAALSGRSTSLLNKKLFQMIKNNVIH